MTEIKFTEKESGYIAACAIDKKGVLVKTPSAPFPSFYRKGVIAKKGEVFVVAKEFRSMFYLDDAAVQVDLTDIESGADDDGKKFKYGETGDVIVDETPCDYAEFHRACMANLGDRRTKGVDEFQLIDKIAQVYEIARETRAANGDDGARSERTLVGRRKKWRYDLADVVATYFHVEVDIENREIIFTGDKYMAGAAELSFEYLFKIGNRRAQRRYDECLAADEPTIGVYAEKAAEFMAEVEKRLRHEGAEIEVDGEIVGEVVVDLDSVEE